MNMMEGSPLFVNDCDSTKKAVHVKWAGKTIALGTFSLNEAEEKCLKAKALTRAWRSTMRPRPSREWVIAQLEKFGARILNGRSGHDINRQDDNFSDEDDEDKYTEVTRPQSRSKHPQFQEALFPRIGLINNEQRDNLYHLEESMTSTNLSTNNFKRDRPIDNNWKQDGAPKRRSAFTGVLLFGSGVSSEEDTSSLNKGYRLQDQKGLAPTYRPFVDGGTAAAYNLLKEDHNMKLAAQRKAAESTHHSEKPLNHSLIPTAPFPLRNSQGSSSIRHHYEMLKIHHMNLMKEIQETEIMMDIFKQEMLMQQQEKMHEDLLRQELLKHLLTQKQQHAISSFYARAYKQTPKRNEPSRTESSDLRHAYLPANMTNMFKASTFSNSSTGSDLMSQLKNSSTMQQAKNVHESTSRNFRTGEEYPQLRQHLQLEHLKAEILEKKSLFGAMSKHLYPRHIPETLVPEADDDQHHSI